MQEDYPIKMIKKNQETQKDQIIKKNIYGYLPKYGARFGEDESYRQQRMRRSDLLTMDSHGYLDADKKLSKYIAVMRSSKRIRRIGLSSSSTNENAIPYGRFGELREGLKKQSSLQNIRLSLDITMDDEAMKKLTYGMKRLVNLRGTSLQIGYKQAKITDEGIKDLSQSFKRLHALKSLELSLYCCNKITDKGYQALGAGLGKLIALQNLSLTSNSSVITEKGSQALVQGFKPSISLQNIKLAFKWLTVNGLEKMRDTLMEMSHLKKIVIDFACESFDGNEALERLSHELKGLASIKNLYLKNLGLCETQNEGIGIVNQAFQELPLLNGLQIDFVMICSDAVENINAFHQALKKFSFLKDLHINFQRCSFKEQGMDLVVSLSEALKELKALKKLSLEFDFKVSEKELEVLNQAFKELHSLESFELTIFNGSAFTSQRLQELRETLQQMKSLQNLKLYFYKSALINGNELRGMLEGLEGLESFRNISLEFQSCSKISNQDLRILSESLRKIPSLKNVHLSFSRCEQVPEDGILELCESFKRRLYCRIDYNADGVVKTYYQG